MTLPSLSGEFTVVADPELKYSPSGVAMARVRLVANSRKKNEQSGEWEDDKTLWMSGTAFKQQAENIAESVQRGSKVTVTGRLQTDEWQAEDGTKRSATALIIDSIGLSLRFDPAKKVEKAQAASAPAGGDNPWDTASSEPPF